MTEIETGRLLLRHWREEDLDPYARICADPEIMRYTRAGSPLTRERTEQRVTATIRHREERGFGLWAVEEKATGAFIGRIGLLYHEDWPEGEHKTEVGWLLDRSFWGRGLATAPSVASVRFGFEKLGLERINQYHTPGERSLAAGDGESGPDLPRRDPLAGHGRGVVHQRPFGLGSGPSRCLRPVA